MKGAESGERSLHEVQSKGATKARRGVGVPPSSLVQSPESNLLAVWSYANYLTLILSLQIHQIEFETRPDSIHLQS